MAVEEGVMSSSGSLADADWWAGLAATATLTRSEWGEDGNLGAAV